MNSGFLISVIVIKYEFRYIVVLSKELWTCDKNIRQKVKLIQLNIFDYSFIFDVVVPNIIIL